MRPEISVIVPVYNAEAYLERCVNSILRQDFSNFELLLIDDGSAAACAGLCDALARKDSRIRVFHRENGGTSAARNDGIAKAAGRFLIFADSDDYVLDTWLSALYASAVATNADIVKSGVYLVTESDYSEESGGRVHVPAEPLQAIRYEKGTITDFEFLKNLAEGGYGAVWNQLVKAELFQNCRFWEGHLAEDIKICAELCQIADRIERVDAIGYCYVQHPTSQLHIAAESFVADNMDFWLELSQVFRNKYHCRERSDFAKAYAVRCFLAHSCSSVRIDENFESDAFWDKWEKLRKNHVTFRLVFRYLEPRLAAQYVVFAVSPCLYKTVMHFLKHNGK